MAEYVRPEDRPVDWVDCTQYKKDPPWKIAFASQGPTNSWALMLDGHAEYAIEEKYAGLFSDYFYAGCDAKADKQVSDVESLLMQKPDVLLMCGMGEALLGVTERAYDMGIPTVHMQMPFQTEKYTSYVNTNNYEIGYKQVDWLCKKLGGEGRILCAAGIAGVDTAVDRYRGAKDAMAKYPGIEEAAMQWVNWSVTEAKKAFEAWLPAYPDIDGIWADGGFAAWAAIEAYSEAGLKVPPLTGDSMNGQLRLVKEHNVPFYAAAYTMAMSMDSVTMAVAIMRGETVPKYYKEPLLEFDDSEIDKYFNPDMSDDVFMDYHYPVRWLEKQFPS